MRKFYEIQALNAAGLLMLVTGFLLPLVALAQADMVFVPAGGFMMGCSVDDPDCEKDDAQWEVKHLWFLSSR